MRAVTSVKEGALLVPQRAVSELQGSYQVAVVGADKKVSIRTVKVGERSGSMWVVEDGLKPGEAVVAEGTQKVRPGMTVEPKPLLYIGSGTDRAERVQHKACSAAEPQGSQRKRT